MIAVATVAFLVRLWHVLQTSTLPTVEQPIGDSRVYLQWASQLAEGDWYGTETFYQAPLYPYFLGILITVGGPSLTWIRIVQAILGSLGAILLGGAAKRLFDAKTGLVTAGMAALYGPGIYYDGIIQKAALSNFLLSLLIYLLAVIFSQRKATSARRIVLATAIGCGLGLLCLTRENSLLWIPLIPLWMAWVFRSDGPVQVTKLIGGFALGLLLILFPVAARNASLGGEWSPTTFQSGPNFYIGNGIGATGVYEPLVPGHESPEYERADAQALAESFVGRPLSPREVSKFWTTRALMEILEQPGRWVMLMGRKMLMTVNYYEVPDVESPYVHKFWSTPLRALLSTWGFGFLFPLSVSGMYLASRHFKLLWLFPVLTASMVIAVAAFFILGRYRLPLVPLLVPFAAYGVVHLLREATSRRRRVVTGLLLVGSLGIVYLPIHNVRGLTASAYMNTGVGFGKAGNAQESLHWIGESIAIRGETAVGLYNLSGAQLLAEQSDAAIESLQKAVVLNPAFLEAELKLARLFDDRGDSENAQLHYLRVLQLDPGNSEAAIKTRSGPE